MELLGKLLRQILSGLEDVIIQPKAIRGHSVKMLGVEANLSVSHP